MITFLLSPKPFRGNAGRIQRNTILACKAVHPEAEVIIYGDGEGVGEVCGELGVYHVPDTPCSPLGVPYFNGIVEHARDNAKYDILCYMNSDIILLGDIIGVLKNISFDQFLLTGQRIGLKEGVEVDCAQENWQVALFETIESNRVELHTQTANDYFIFKRGMWESLLPLVIGRGGYDDALILYCLRNKIPFINATFSILAIHQFHDYGHQKGGKQAVFEGEDARNNIRLHRNYYSRPNSADAPWLLVNGVLTKNLLQRDMLRKIEQYVRFVLRLERFSLVVRFFWRLATRIGILKPRLITLNQIIEVVVKQRSLGL
jgi:hypothetical protein